MLKYDKYYNEILPIYDNKFGEKDYYTWEKMEFDLTQGRVKELQCNPNLVNQTFDSNHILELHKYIFQDCYDWAGTIRDNGGQTSPYSWHKTKTIDGKDYMSIYTPDSYINNRMPEIKDIMRNHNYGKEYNKEQVGDLLGELSDRINEIHFFREGNSRTKRMFLQQVANKCNFDLNFSKISVEKLTNDEFLANSISVDGKPFGFDTKGRIELLKKTYMPLLEEKQMILEQSDGSLKSSEVVMAQIKDDNTKKEFERLLNGEDTCKDISRSQNKLLNIVGAYTDFDTKQMTSVFKESALSNSLNTAQVSHKVDFLANIFNSAKKANKEVKTTQKKQVDQRQQGK